jgi:hypothetical protein
MKKLVVLTGSGISSESGLKTFRDSGGLWENYDVMEVASYAGWTKNMELVLQFYNERRSQLKSAEPNNAHKGLVELEEFLPRPAVPVILNLFMKSVITLSIKGTPVTRDFSCGPISFGLEKPCLQSKRQLQLLPKRIYL